jgi:hypothetical protein
MVRIYIHLQYQGYPKQKRAVYYQKSIRLVWELNQEIHITKNW